jgi:hypothetical protein
VAKPSADFICVKGTQKLANQYKVKGAPLVVIVDPDGAELVRAPIGTGESALLAAWDQALKKYAPREISWSSEPPPAGGGKPLLVVGFDDARGEGLKVLEDRMIAKYHDKCAFVKLPYEKDGDAAKRWGVSSAPAIILCDAKKENPEKSPIEKLTGPKAPAALRVAILKALLKLEPRK